jgi:hypothetical protein
MNCTQNPLSLRLAEVFPELSQQLVQINKSAHRHSSALHDQDIALQNIASQLGKQPQRYLSLLSQALTNGVSSVLSQTAHETELPIVSRENENAATESNGLQVTRNSNSPAGFKMNRRITTVRKAWVEFKYGGVSNNGGLVPSIETLESQPGPKWRGALSSTEGKFYMRRKPLYGTVKRLIEEEKKLEDDVLDALQALMVDKCKGSLRKLCDHLQSVLAGGEEGIPLSVYITQ